MFAIFGVHERTSGWQALAASTRESLARQAVLRCADRSQRALLRSEGGIGAALATSAAPTSKECTLPADRFQIVLRRRLRWPLPLASARCEGCGAAVDHEGDHYSACMPSGRVRCRAVAVEQTVARICREAGARVRNNVG